MLQKGCKRILLMRDLRHASSIRNRKAGYLEALQEAGVEYDETLEISVFPEYDNAVIAGALLAADGKWM